MTDRDPTGRSFQGSLRDAMAVDGLDPGDVYAGTTAGQVVASSDNGETWTTLQWTFPRVLSVHAFVE